MTDALHRPHQTDPHAAKVRVLLLYKNFKAKAGISHIGLGVSLYNTMQTLRRAGVWVDVEPIVNPKDAQAVLERKFKESQAHNPPQPFYSHVVFSAPWVPVEDFAQLLNAWPQTTFLSLCHSNVGFLQYDARGVHNLRGYLDLEKGTHNFQVAGNNTRFVEWVRNAYQAPCVYLPNLYFLKDRCAPHRRHWDGTVLRVGAFCAVRPQKNLMSCVGAALEMHQWLRVDTEVYISSGRPENTAVITKALHEMIDGVPGIKLIDNGWQEWPKFVRTIGQMDVMVQVSYSETFNIVVADGISQGVPTVVSDAIEWAPTNWQANPDDATDIARKGVHLLQDLRAPVDGWKALTKYVDDGVAAWKKYLVPSSSAHAA